MCGANEEIEALSLFGEFKAAFTLIRFTNTATFAVYVFQAFTLIQQLRFHCNSSFVFISIHFGIRIHFYPFWVCVFVY